MNYSTTKKELLTIVFAFKKFRTYLLGYETIVYKHHATTKFLFDKKESKPRLMRSVTLLQEFNLEIKDKQGLENIVANHLS